MTTVLAVESSCDDTCAAVIGEDGSIRSNVISSQRAHDRFGGVVPEIASRHHLELIDVVVERALQEAEVELDGIDLVAATQGPGLIGALLVGFSAAKGIAAARELPFVAVDHIQGHVAANFLLSEAAPSGDAGKSPNGSRAAEDSCVPSPAALEPPFLCLIASGGHTLLVHVREHHGFQEIGRTLRRRRRRGLRQGRAHARPRLSGRTGAGAPRRRRRPAGVRVPGLGLALSRRSWRHQRLRSQPGLLLRRSEDLAAVSHPRSRRGCIAGLRARSCSLLPDGDSRSPAAPLRAGTRAHGPGSPGRGRRRGRQRRAAPPAELAGRRVARAADGALHGQRGDDRQRRALRPAIGVPGLPRLGRLCDRRTPGIAVVSVLVTLYGSPECHLCEQARALLLRVRADHDFELVECDITGDDDLHRAYLERIPVIVVDGEEWFDLIVPERELRARLASH